ncbi:MAG: hypothetical protein II938_00985 [Alphaproteobacteria bacterium]|nr:hypothetical protein [Alphaproteobacteria bacterium]
MDLIAYFNDKIDCRRIEDFSSDMKEMALVRYVIWEAAKLLHRDDRFFLFKEDLKNRSSIYEKEPDIRDLDDLSIVCSSYTAILAAVLRYYGINAERIAKGKDRYRHMDLLITTQGGKKYILDPLTDLIEMQTQMKTNYFGTEACCDKYKEIIPDLSVFNERDLQQIDDAIGYRKNNQYAFSNTKILFQNLVQSLKENAELRKRLSVSKDKCQNLSDQDIFNLKVQFLINVCKVHPYVTGMADLIVFIKMMMGRVFTPQELKKVSVDEFFFEKQDLKTPGLESNFVGKERYRGLLLKVGDDENYIFSLKNNVCIRVADLEWFNLVINNKIYVKPHNYVKLLAYLKEIRVDRNLLHHGTFLKAMHDFETKCEEQHWDLEKIKESLIITPISVTICADKMMEYKIVNNALHITNKTDGKEYRVSYEDEGRHTKLYLIGEFETEPRKHRTGKIDRFKFDAMGIFELDDDKGICDLVTPLINGHFLSRNCEYYKSKTISENKIWREELKKRLRDTKLSAEKQYIILEYMLNSSVRVYYEELKKFLDIKTSALDLQQSKKAVEEDCANIIRLLESKPIRPSIVQLPDGKEYTTNRIMEMDYKPLLYHYIKSLFFKRKKHLIIPGFGSMLIGPFFKYIHGFSYTNLLFSKYANKGIEKLEDSVCDWRGLVGVKDDLLLFDDNVATGRTLREIKQKISQELGKDCECGAVAFNWTIHSDVKNGVSNLETFDIDKVEYMSVFDDPGHWIGKHAIEHLYNSGNDYLDYLKFERVYAPGKSGEQILRDRAIEFARNCGVDLQERCGENIPQNGGISRIGRREYER